MHTSMGHNEEIATLIHVKKKQTNMLCIVTVVSAFEKKKQQNIQPEKSGLKLEVVLKWRNISIYIESISGPTNGWS